MKEVRFRGGCHDGKVLQFHSPFRGGFRSTDEALAYAYATTGVERGVGGSIVIYSDVGLEEILDAARTMSDDLVLQHIPQTSRNHVYEVVSIQADGDDVTVEFEYRGQKASTK